MCPPLIPIIAFIAAHAVEISIATTVASVVGTIASTVATQQQQAAQAHQMQQAAQAQMDFKATETLRRLRQERMAASEKVLEQRVEEVAAKGKVKALSGAGLSENSIATLSASIGQKVDRNVGLIQKQEQFSVGNAFASLRAGRLQFESDLSSINQPNPAATGIKIGTTVVGGLGSIGTSLATTP